MSARLLPRRSARGLGDAGPASDVRGPIFIGGLDRSGKTTMRAFLASHPNIAIPAVGSNMETYFYGRFGDLARERNMERCLSAMLRYKHVRYLDPDPERVRREFRDGPATYERLFSLFLVQFAERQGKPRWGAQTGLIERYARELFDAFEGVRVIHMVRDPRDRYAASLEAWPDGRGRAGGAVARWRYSMRLAERNAQRFGDRYLVVRFEDLIEDTEATVRAVCAFVGEGFVPEMLSMVGAPEHRRKLVGDVPEARVRLSSRFIGGFRAGVPKRELAFMQLHAGRLMRAYGYEPEPITMAAGERVRFVVAEWPSQFARMAGWRAVEAVQQRFPGLVGRRPDGRMIVEPVGRQP
jgi:hypothetical protein